MKREKNDVELLSPAGDMECLIAAVQNGANAIYFGANKFNARANSTNFNDEELKLAIEYAKLRNVKTHLTLNILIKNSEFQDALNLVKYAYKLGIDAVIVQDLGLAEKIKQYFPDLELHASTQTTTYNVEGVEKLSSLGFDRVVLARELSVKEIKDICENTKTDIEVFVHGALCISYSGQCLMSSIIGGRSGNRGKCAGTCRLPYELVTKHDGMVIEKGYLLSSKDVCTLDILPEMIEAGVKSFKIEGRMKSAEYVGIVTKIYRKYIDMYFSSQPYTVDDEDRKMLMQVFNRGGFSTGYLKGKLGKDMMFIDKPNHIGIEIGKVEKYNKIKGYIDIKLKEEFALGDSISINDSSCKSSELMIKGENVKKASIGQLVTIGRIKGNIQINDVVYKTVSESLINNASYVTKNENIKRKVNVKIILKKGEQIKLEIKDISSNITTLQISENIIENAQKTPTTKERIIQQLQKTGNTIFEIENIDIDMDKDIFVSISDINEIRRLALDKLKDLIINTFSRKEIDAICEIDKKQVQKRNVKNVSLLLNVLKNDIDYMKIKNVDNIYIPFRYFVDSEFKDIINEICNKYDTYIYLPAITKFNYVPFFKNDLDKFNIKGSVISNLSQLQLVSRYISNKKLVANYTMNIFNNNTINLLQKYNFDVFTVSPELNESLIQNLNGEIEKEVIVYGRTLLMTSEYCVIGKNGACNQKCVKNQYMLRDRKNFLFPIYTDKTNCNSLIYNSKITSIQSNSLNADSIRIDILDEDIDKINEVIKIHLLGKRLEGEEYTNGNLNKEI